jgi:hypothetical protein
MIEQRYVSQFSADEGKLGVEVYRRRKEHYCDDAVPRSEVYRWIRDVKGGRADLETIPRPDRPPAKDFPT